MGSVLKFPEAEWEYFSPDLIELSSTSVLFKNWNYLDVMSKLVTLVSPYSLMATFTPVQEGKWDNSVFPQL